MPSDWTTILKALEELNKSASFAQKYGPFFFAIALLVLTPFIALVVFKRFIGDPQDRLRQHAYDDFRFYFRLTIVIGLLCVVVGVAWWVFENFREDGRIREKIGTLTAEITQLQTANRNKKYVIYGLIKEGINNYDRFTPTMTENQTVVFSRIPGTNNLIFVILSDEEIPNNLAIVVTWEQYDGSTGTQTHAVIIPLQLTVSGGGLSMYRFRFDQQIGKLEPY